MNLVSKRISWNETVDRHLSRACFTPDDMAYYKSNDVILMGVFTDEGAQVGSYLLRFDEKELVVVAAGGAAFSGGLYKSVVGHVVDIARQNKANTLRGHCMSKAVGRLMRAAGWELSEYVYRIKL